MWIIFFELGVAVILLAILWFATRSRPEPDSRDESGQQQLEDKQQD